MKQIRLFKPFVLIIMSIYDDVRRAVPTCSDIQQIEEDVSGPTYIDHLLSKIGLTNVSQEGVWDKIKVMLI